VGFGEIPVSYRRLAGAFFFVCFLLFAAMGAFERFAPRTHGPVPTALDEDWQPGLGEVRSIDEAMKVLPAYIARERGSREMRIARGVDRFVRDRFFHEVSLLSWRENWLAALSGFVWINLRQPVLPDDILHHRRAICSQQAIVAMELLKRFGLHRAAVTFAWSSPDPLARGHFALAARVDGRWLYFDPDQEPPFDAVPVERIIDGTAIGKLYAGKPQMLRGMRDAAARGDVRMTWVDAFPAPRGGLFQRVTAWLSAYGWLPLGLLAFALLRGEIGLRRRRAHGAPLPA
jgi:hypothetical protein